MAHAQFDVGEAVEIRRTIAKAQALLAEATRRLDAALTPPAEVGREDDQPLVIPSGSTVAALHGPLHLDDLDLRSIHRVVESLPAVFDTYHVVEHDEFRRAHSTLLSHPALNQLAGKALRRNAAVLGIRYGDQRGRRRSALWHKEPEREHS